MKPTVTSSGFTQLEVMHERNSIRSSDKQHIAKLWSVSVWPHLSGSDGDWTSSYGKLTFFHNVKQDGHEHGSLIILRVQHSNKGMSVSNMHPICLFGWLAGLLIGCFVCWRCGSFIAGCLVSWLALIRWIVSLVTWLVGFSISWLACWLVAKRFQCSHYKNKVSLLFPTCPFFRH